MCRSRQLVYSWGLAQMTPQPTEQGRSLNPAWKAGSGALGTPRKLRESSTTTQVTLRAADWPRVAAANSSWEGATAVTSAGRSARVSFVLTNSPQEP